MMRIGDIFAGGYHPQTVGKFEHLNRTAKGKLGLELYRPPEDLGSAVEEFKGRYSHERYHEIIGNLYLVDVYEGRAEGIISRRKEVQQRTSIV